jgi:hypothetical protein
MFRRIWNLLFGKSEPIHIEVIVNVKEITIRTDNVKEPLSGSNSESEKERSVRFVTAKPVSDEEAVADLEERLDNKTANAKTKTDEPAGIAKPAVKFGREVS